MFIMETATTASVMKSPRTTEIRLPYLRVSTAEAMNPSKRATMEDRHVIHAPDAWGVSNRTYLAVYDGHGGRDMVDFLEHGLSHHIAEELSVEDEAADMKTRLERAFLMADIHSRKVGVLSSGATVACCLIKRDPLNPVSVEITTANVGDARIVLCHDGATTRLTTDHNADNNSEVARIQQAGGFVVKRRVMGVLAVTRSLGDHMLKKFVIGEPEVQELNLQVPSNSSTFLIIACDGLWDVMTDQEAANLLQNFAGDSQEAAGYLVEEAIRRGTTDNVTVIIAWL